MSGVGGVGGEAREDVFGGVILAISEEIVPERIDGLHLVVGDALELLKGDEPVHEAVDHKLEIARCGLFDFDKLTHGFGV